jgi:UDP-glucuronate 4-epimerase
VRILVTGSAGFIGFHLARRLLLDGHEVTGIDALTPYYDVDLKRRRHQILAASPRFAAHVTRLEDAGAILEIAAAARPDAIVHLAAQAGVRHSLEAPRDYLDSNLTGTFNVMEAARVLGVAHLLFASTSSVYGANAAVPFRETDAADHPLTFYAASKKAGEAMTHSYAHLWNIPTTVFRFFTVYGPWGRPDMALFKFAQAMLQDRPIEVYNQGRLQRDFTYVEDLVEAIVRLTAAPPRRGEPVGPMDSLSPAAPWRVVNIGRGEPVKLMDFIAILEGALGRSAMIDFKPMQPGDMESTFASADLLHALTGYRPDSTPDVGVQAFCDWFTAYLANPDATAAQAARGLR